VLEHLQQLCNWNLPFVRVCQVPKRFVKGKISSSPNVWYFWLDISQNSGPNYFFLESFIFREIFSRVARALSFSRTIPSPVARSFAAIDLRDQLDVAAARGLRRLPHGGEPQQDDGIVVQERHGEDAAMDLLASRRCKKRRRRWISSSLHEERRWRAQERRRRAGERKESRVGRTRLAGNYRDVGGTDTTRSPRFSRYKNCQATVPMQKCQVWSIKCQVCQNA